MFSMKEERKATIMKLHTHSEISIRCSPERLFQLVTTPDNWVGRHPMTVRVSGDTHHSLEVGEQCIEEVRVGVGGVDQPPLSANWHVTRRQAPLLWEIQAQFPAQLPLPGLQHARGSLRVVH